MRIGIDEAGKGPVLGPMVAAAVGVPDPDILPEGIADSKRLTADRRVELDAALRSDERIAVGVAAVEVERIDAPETDMNGLAVAGQAEATEAILSNASSAGDAAAPAGRTRREIDLLADACDTSESRFARRLVEAIDGGNSGTDDEHCDLAIEARHGADDEDPVVAAASIVAKVERDAQIAGIADDVGVDVGSGYPSDPTTRSFLEAYVRDHGALPDCARRSWQTCEDVLASAEQLSLGDY